MSNHVFVVLRHSDHSTFAFGSVSAIFQRFSEEEIGCSRWNLYKIITKGKVYDNRRFRIQKCDIAKSHRNAT